MLAVGGRKVFVAHRAAGVHVIPQEWLDAWRPNGFREATPAEVLAWYDERDVDAPAEVVRAVRAAQALVAGDADGERTHAAITLP